MAVHVAHVGEKNIILQYFVTKSEGKKAVGRRGFLGHDLFDSGSTKCVRLNNY